MWKTLRWGLLVAGLLSLPGIALGGDGGVNFPPGSADAPGSVNPVKVEAIVNGFRVVRDRSFMIRVQIAVDTGFHINSNHPKDKFLIPTRVTLNNVPDFTFQAAKFPQPVERQFAFSPDKLSVYEGEIEVNVPALYGKEGSLGKKTISGSVRYQSCDANTCYPPRTASFTIPVEVVK